MTFKAPTFVFMRMYGNYLSYVSLEMAAGAVLPLDLLNADIHLWHLGGCDTEVSCSYHSAITKLQIAYVPLDPVTNYVHMSDLNTRLCVG